MKGFTLFEILVAILILTFIVGGICGVLNISKTNYDTNLVSLNLQRQARQGMSRLSREIRQAKVWDSINIVPAPPDFDINGNNSITFNTPDATTGTSVNYCVTRTVVSGKELWQLQRTDSAHTVPEIIANDIRVLKFLKDSTGHLLNIQVQASKTFHSLGKDRTLTFPLTEKVAVRN